MSDIFISYASPDRPWAQKLATAFEQRGWSVWWDLQIPPGKTFAQVIQGQLDAAQCVIVLWSQHSIGSDWVQIEAEDGRQRGILIPALVEDIDPRQIPLQFRGLHAARLIDWNGAAPHTEFDQLVAEVGQRIQPSSPSPRPKPSAPEEPISPTEAPVIEKAETSSWWKYALGISLLLLLASGAWYASTNQDPAQSKEQLAASIANPTPNNEKIIQQHLTRGKSHHELGEYEQALTEFEQAKKLDSSYAEVLASIEDANRAWNAEKKLGYKP